MYREIEEYISEDDQDEGTNFEKIPEEFYLRTPVSVEEIRLK